jgi:hypothetical protein
MERRRKECIMPPYKANRNVLWKFIKNTMHASEGCITDGA